MAFREIPLSFTLMPNDLLAPGFGFLCGITYWEKARSDLGEAVLEEKGPAI